MDCRILIWCLLYLTLASLYISQAQKCEKMTDLSIAHAIVGTSVRVRLLLYTRANQTCGTLLSHDDITVHPEFNLTRPTVFVIHGFRPTGSPPVWLDAILELLLARGDMNVIVVDWNHGATHINYLKVKDNTRLVADNITDFVQKMKEHGQSLSSIHMIGVSLGAHISGFVGAKFLGAIGRITALDPAGPWFTDNPPEDRLDPTDAQFVDAVHTDMDALGFRKPLGHIDFYPNGGADQPSCPKTILGGTKYFKCDHQRSVYLYLNSLNRTCRSFAYPCTSYTEFLDGRCMDCKQFGSSGCPVFGYDIIDWKKSLVRLGQTMAYFTTNGVSPFCKYSYRVDMVTWNQQTIWGYIVIKLYSKELETVARINHKASKFEQFVETSMLAQFDRDLQPVQKISVKFCTESALRPAHKLRLLRVRLTSLESSARPMCRYDLLLEANREVTFRPIPCEGTNF